MSCKCSVAKTGLLPREKSRERGVENNLLFNNNKVMLFSYILIHISQRNYAFKYMIQAPFTTSAVILAQPKHKLYKWVDWTKVEAGSYAVVDPVNPGDILYLTEQDYVVMVRVTLTSGRTLKVLAQPGDSMYSDAAPQSSSDTQNSSFKDYESLLGHP